MRKLLLLLIEVYRKIFSPILRSLAELVGVSFQCKYPVSCSEFAELELIHSKSIIRALTKILIRLLSCGPGRNRWTHEHS